MEQASSILVGAVTFALVYQVCRSIVGFYKRVAVVVAFSLAVITYVYLSESPTVLASTIEKIAL
jgi:hypothetical protein